MKKSLKQTFDRESGVQNGEDLNWLRGLKRVTNERKNYCFQSSSNVSNTKIREHVPVESLNNTERTVRAETFVDDSRTFPLDDHQSTLSADACPSFLEPFSHVTDSICTVLPLTSFIGDPADVVLSDSSQTTSHTRAGWLSHDHIADCPIQDLVASFCRVSSTPRPRHNMSKEVFERTDVGESKHVLSTQVRSFPIESFQSEQPWRSESRTGARAPACRHITKLNSQSADKGPELLLDLSPPSEPVSVFKPIKKSDGYRLESEQKGKRKGTVDFNDIVGVKRRLDFATYTQVSSCFLISCFPLHFIISFLDCA